MPTSGDLKSGDTPVSIYPTPPPPEKKEMKPPPHQIDLHAPKSTKSFQDFLSRPKYSEGKSISNLLVNGDPVRESVIWP